MEQPIFYKGQRVICVDGGEPVGTCGTPNPIIEGKSYYISDPQRVQNNNHIYVSLSGFNPNFAWRQDCFIPYEDDNAMQEQIREAMNEHLKIRN